MTQEKDSKDKFSGLRKRAEVSVDRSVSDVEDITDLSTDEVQRIIQELRVHQIELEIQNEDLRQAQIKLEELRDRYLDLYDFAPVGYVTLNDKGLILEANLTAVRLLGVERQTLTNRPFSRFVCKEFGDAYYLHLQQVFETQLKQLCEIDMKGAEGNLFHAQLESVSVQDESGLIERCRTIVSDITWRKKLENVQSFLLEAGYRNPDEDFFEVLAKYLAKTLEMDFICIDRLRGDGLTAQTVAVHFDGKFEDNIEYALKDTPCGEVVGKAVCSFPKDVRQLFPNDKVLQEMMAESYVGVTLWGSKREPIGLIAVIGRQACSDLRLAEMILKLVAVRAAGELERREAELALRDSEELSHAVFESTDDAIYIKDRSLRFQHVNSALCRLVGLPADEIIGKKAEEVHGEEQGQLINEREARVLEGESIDMEHTMMVEDTAMTFHDVVVPLMNLAGNIVGVYCISRNITERKMVSAKQAPKIVFYPSRAMQRTFHVASMAARSDSIILLQGESGSGKDFLARWIHDRSHRSTGPYFTVNCAAVPTDLAESELFGHEKGAFTGAQGLKRGLLELAEGGTILLNEIGELSLAIQAKLLAFLDTRSFVRVGGQRHIHVNARLIAASHRDLREEVEENRFLEPLFYRISVFPIRVPPLRERREDLPVLTEQLIARLASEMQLTELPVIDTSVIKSLRDYNWPGNVRELRNVLERSLMLWHGGRLAISLPDSQQPTLDTSDLEGHKPDQGLQEALDEVVFSFCERELRASGGNKKEAAKQLGISRDTLYRYLKKMEKRPKNQKP